MKKMINEYPLLYMVLMGVAFCFILFASMSLKTDSYSKEKSDWCKEYSGFEVEKNKGNISMVTVLPEHLSYDSTFGFYTQHSDVKVTVDGVVIYAYRCSKNNYFGKTAGYRINILPNLYEYRGKNLEISVVSEYHQDEVPTVYLGDGLGIYRHFERTEMFAIMICVITLTVGIILFLVWYAFRGRVQNSLLYLGLFAINVAIYNVNEQNILSFMIHDGNFQVYVALLSLAMMPIPFLLFLKDLYHEPEDKYWYVALIFMFANTVLQILLQVTGLVEMRRMLIITHLGFVLMFLIIIYETIHEINNYSLSKSMRLNIVCIILVVICLLIDMVRYYATDGMVTSYWANMAFLIYVMIVGVQVISENRELMDKGREATLYEQMAYTDKLTGLGNRTLHDKLMLEADVRHHQYIVCVFDLNNLKKCNDSLGHAAGDEYIRSSAGILQTCFEKVVEGKVCRIGGDEFCVVLKDKKLEVYEKCVNQMKQFCADYNALDNPVKICIAYGYAMYNPELDLDLKETRSRADSVMYQMKFEMKEQQQKQS